MDASASPKSNSDVYGFFLIHDSPFPASVKQRNTVIKYTKLPNIDFDSRVTWPRQSYTLQPRLRRIITLDNQELKTSRSLKPERLAISQVANACVTKRKIVTIAEVDEPDLHPNFSRDVRKRQSPVKTSSRSVGPSNKEEKETIPHKTSSRISTSSKYSKEANPSAKMSNAYHRNEVSLSRVNYRSRQPNTAPENNRIRNIKEKDTMRNSKSANAPNKISLSKNILFPRESDKEVSVIKKKLLDSSKSYVIPKKDLRIRNKSPPSQNRTKVLYMKEIQMKNKPVSIIHVPLEEKCYSEYQLEESQISQTTLCLEDGSRRDCATETEVVRTNHKDAYIATDPLPVTVDHITEMDNDDLFKSVETVDTQTVFLKETFDSLDIPNVSLIKDRSARKDEVYQLNSKSLPNLKVTLNTYNEDDKENKSDVSSSSDVASYVLSRAILTYTTRRKIDVQVLGSNDNNNTNQTSSPLCYPMNVMSVFKTEIKNRDSKDIPRKKEKANVVLPVPDYTNYQKSLSCSLVLNSDKLMKPSDMISSISGGSGFLQGDYITEQFQKELNFIDSFFESLQYLESSLSDNCLKVNNIESLVNNSQLELKSPDYAAFLSKFENGANIYDTETMASKSLCLLNLLIRDEQRRAKNLLFVLKMREDALKDFTKSQILWLEKKKKQDNTDISTLKKKQRGALLRLQHECGEMQRMRKALLTLSEKRKVALMKTKKNIELKLNNNVDVEQILLGKKKPKRSISADRSVAPLKCFDLSSSGCEDSSASRTDSEASSSPYAASPLPAPANTPAPTPAPAPSSAPSSTPSSAPVTSAEKGIQTNDSILATILVDQSTDTAAENFVVVDGGYLNILFHNLSLPKIFSTKRQYEVNEEALKNILNSANSNHNNLNDSDVVEKLMDQIKNCDLDRSSSPSTAHSLVEEFDQYYKGLTEQDKSQVDVDQDKVEMCEIGTQVLETVSRGQQVMPEELSSAGEAEVMMGDSWREERECECDGEASAVIVSGPLPVPAGATNPAAPPASASTWLLPKSSPSTTLSDTISVSSQPLCLSTSGASLASPAHSEAEELRRQQLAIEREIKALEQQQCQLLVVREIPDKPPPPYTPPAPVDTRIVQPPRPFLPGDVTEEKIRKCMSDEGASLDAADSFDTFIKDYCDESVQKHHSEQTDKPWDSCNLLPQKPPLNKQELMKKTTSDLKDVLTGVPPTVVTGVSSRRTDHIDDILFAEWRRCEPEWTSLHTDEAIVKNQIFESIFQKILTETVDAYKKTVQYNQETD